MSIIISKQQIDEALATTPKRGKTTTLDVTLTHGAATRIVRNVDASNRPEVHSDEADLWEGLTGSVTFILGGELTGELEVIGNTTLGEGIEGGTEFVLTPGTMLYIPAGEVHAHYGTGEMLVTKIPNK